MCSLNSARVAYTLNFFYNIKFMYGTLFISFFSFCFASFHFSSGWTCWIVIFVGRATRSLCVCAATAATVFLKYYHVELLAKLYEEQLRKIVLVQACVRRWLARVHFKRARSTMTQSAMTVQRYVRGWLTRKRLQQMRNERKQRQKEEQQLREHRKQSIKELESKFMLLLLLCFYVLLGLCE